MNRFVIIEGLPYLIDKDKLFAVRWDDKGFTVGTEVKKTDVPTVIYSELSIKAQCAGCLDSITPEQQEETKEPEQQEETKEPEQQEETKEPEQQEKPRAKSGRKRKAVDSE